jgi:hypothetical protein
MAGFSVNGKNLMVGALPAAPMVSLHSADPGNTGANELAGGGYAKLVGALAAAGGAGPVLRHLTVAGQHTVPAGSTVAYVGVWSADGATFLDSFAVTAESYSGAGFYQVNDSTIGLA